MAMTQPATPPTTPTPVILAPDVAEHAVVVSLTGIIVEAVRWLWIM